MSGKMSLKGSRTEKNLMASFAGESQARNRYSYFSSAAKKEGFMQISAIFAETAQQESEHAKRFFKLMDGGEIEITGRFPAGPIGKTLDNLKASAAGEHHEHSEMYPGFAKVAREEGFEAVAKAFETVAIAERQHEMRYRKLAETMERGETFKRSKTTTWRCRNCGYVHDGMEAPANCIACVHPQSHFEAIGDIV